MGGVFKRVVVRIAVCAGVWRGAGDGGGGEAAGDDGGGGECDERWWRGERYAVKAWWKECVQYEEGNCLRSQSCMCVVWWEKEHGVLERGLADGRKRLRNTLSSLALVEKPSDFW